MWLDGQTGSFGSQEPPEGCAPLPRHPTPVSILRAERRGGVGTITKSQALGMDEERRLVHRVGCRLGYLRRNPEAKEMPVIH